MLKIANSNTSEIDLLLDLAPKAYIIEYIDFIPYGQSIPFYDDEQHSSRVEQLGEEISFLIECVGAHDVVRVAL